MQGAWRQFPLTHSQPVGDKYIVTIGTDGSDNYPHNFECRVQIRDRMTGQIYERRGCGKYIGNFSPIWVRWNGKDVTVEEILREKVEA